MQDGDGNRIKMEYKHIKIYIIIIIPNFDLERKSMNKSFFLFNFYLIIKEFLFLNDSHSKLI